MAFVKCFAVDGLRLWFPSGDHEPPHFHAQRKGVWIVRVKFLEISAATMFEVKWSDKPMSKQDRNTLMEYATKFRVQLLKEWEQCHQGQ